MEIKFVVLIGMKHCGKSTIGKALSERLELPFFDIDDRITACSGKTPRELYDQGGPSLMQSSEAEAARQLAEELKDNPGSTISAVIAAGGGFCDNEAAITALNNGLFVYLSAPEELLMERITASAERDGRYPAYITSQNPQNSEEIAAIFHSYYTARTKEYASFAEWTEQTEGKSVSEITESLIQTLSRGELI
ncbi:MAG: hypothetical protein LBU99_06320 [Spirochaetaceae bacterium]|jgi:shikimate kinase|nr:hypothetical protein [Spirochaetaceae bacterium]